MEMSPEYALQTAQGMAGHGYTLHREKEEVQHLGKARYLAHRYRLTASERELVLECLQYPDGESRYYFEIRSYHGLRSPSFPLDSWKLGPAGLELRYYTHEQSGIALTLTLQHDASESESQ